MTSIKYSILYAGDLNYRKLVGDREWPCETTSFDEALCNFNPAPLLTLRTLKSDVCVGLKPGTVKRLDDADKDWMVNGKYAVVQFSDKVVPVDFVDEKIMESNQKPRVTFS